MKSSLIFSFLSFSVFLLHFSSFSFFFHVLSFDCLSFSVIFFHFLSCSFFFFFFFCFFFCRGSESDFLGLNFVTSSLNISFRKSIYRPVSGVHSFGPSFSFFPPFLTNFFLMFLFFFGSCSSFFPFFLFFNKKISCLFFSFLAFVSGFNKRCFLRKKCSMEMWCLDDIGRDSWDWVGPPAWRRACFNSPVGGVGCSPV